MNRRSAAARSVTKAIRNPSRIVLALAAALLWQPALAAPSTPQGHAERAIALNPADLLPAAAFSARVRQGLPPLAVAFRNESSPGLLPIAGHAWDFGDGTESAQAHPTHTYDAIGEYTVRLTVRNALGADTLVREGYVVVRAEQGALDSDGDGIVNSIDADDDGDGVEDERDAHPLDASRSIAAGRFDDYRAFTARCEAPRTGFDAEGTPFPDRVGATVLENHWLRSWSNDLYLWYDEIEDAEPLRHDDAEAYFDLMKTSARTPSGRARDRFHFTRPTDEWLALTRGGTSAGYGAAFSVLRGAPPRDVRVAYVEPNSPATRAGLARGAAILEVDGVDMANGDDVDTLNDGLFPSSLGETHEFVVQDLGGNARRTITLTAVEVVSDPVQNVGTVNTGAGIVGYMLFNDHIGSAERELVQAVRQLAAAGISDLVLDLRYNGGGYLDLANQLAFMIAGPSAAQGRIFETMRFNDKHTDFNPVTGRRLDPRIFHTTTLGFSAPNPIASGIPLPTLNLPRVFAITGRNTCSASESIINGLRGVDVEVVQIGATTCGKPFGFYPFDNCGTTYFSIQFQGVNAKGFGDYPDGFSPRPPPSSSSGLAGVPGVELPGCLVADDYGHALGDPEEARFRAALAWRDRGGCPAAAAALRAPPAPGRAHEAPRALDGWVPKNLWLRNRWER